MEQYTDYEFYKNQYNGSLITEENQFNRQAIEACRLIDEMTFGRIKKADDLIKSAVCAVAEIGYRESRQNDELQISSESVGPHSVSYVKQTKSTDDYLREKRDAVIRYLAHTGLLYRGIPSCGF